jgi:hypothetical protein
MCTGSLRILNFKKFPDMLMVLLYGPHTPHALRSAAGKNAEPGEINWYKDRVPRDWRMQRGSECTLS